VLGYNKAYRHLCKKPQDLNLPSMSAEIITYLTDNSLCRRGCQPPINHTRESSKSSSTTSHSHWPGIPSQYSPCHKSSRNSICHIVLCPVLSLAKTTIDNDNNLHPRYSTPHLRIKLRLWRNLFRKTTCSYPSPSLRIPSVLLFRLHLLLLLIMDLHMRKSPT
jgi:hypothetical protein